MSQGSQRGLSKGSMTGEKSRLEAGVLNRCSVTAVAWRRRRRRRRQGRGTDGLVCVFCSCVHSDACGCVHRRVHVPSRVGAACVSRFVCARGRLCQRCLSLRGIYQPACLPPSHLSLSYTRACAAFFLLLRTQKPRAACLTPNLHQQLSCCRRACYCQCMANNFFSLSPATACGAREVGGNPLEERGSRSVSSSPRPDPNPTL